MSLLKPNAIQVAIVKYASELTFPSDFREIGDHDNVKRSAVSTLPPPLPSLGRPPTEVKGHAEEVLVN
jgi:hypothetical protein